MPRWDINDSARRRESEPEPQREDRPSASSQSSRAVGRGPSDDLSPTTPTRSERQRETPESSRLGRRATHRDRDRTYFLRSSEINSMSDIGRFRTIDTQDLRRFAYGGDETRMKRDMESLREQGLIEEKTLFRAHKEPRRVVTLTEQGHRIVRKASGLPKDQRIYHGFVKAREINHDADLYKIYQEAVGEVRDKGGKPLKVRLDFELKAAVQREKQAIESLPDAEKRERLASFAREQGVAISGTTIHVPDIQMEYETRDDELERANLELVSENYRSEGIRDKAASGFTIYARGGDAARVRRALQDTHAVERILSI